MNGVLALPTISVAAWRDGQTFWLRMSIDNQNFGGRRSLGKAGQQNDGSGKPPRNETWHSQISSYTSGTA